MPFLFFVCPLQKQSHVAPPHTHTPPPITLPSHPASLSLFTPHPSCHCEVCVSCLTVYSPSPYPQHHTPLYTPTPRLQLLHFYLTPTPFAPQAPPLSLILSLSPHPAFQSPPGRWHLPGCARLVPDAPLPLPPPPQPPPPERVSERTTPQHSFQFHHPLPIILPLPSATLTSLFHLNT